VSISAQIILQVHVGVEQVTSSMEVNALVLLLLFCTLLYCGLFLPVLPKEGCLSVLCLCLTLEQKFAGINRITEAVVHTVYTVFHNCGTSSCQWNNLFNMQFIIYMLKFASRSRR